jgi:hypothetical protein
VVAEPAGHEHRRGNPRDGAAAGPSADPPPSATRAIASIERHTPPDASERSPADELIDLLVAGSRVAVGATAAALAVAADTLKPADRRSERGGEESAFAAFVVGAALGATLDALAITRWAARTGWTAARWGAWLVPTETARRIGRDAAARWDERWQEESDRSREVAAAFAREVVPEVLNAALDTIDLTELVRDRVDVDELAAGVDVDALASTVDLDAIVARIDLDAIVRRIDLDAIVARIDPNEIVERVDLDAAARRVDVATIAREVIDELDLLELIRESSATVTTDVVDDIRLGAVDADRAVARVVDRILRRRTPRGVDGDAGSGTDAVADAVEEAALDDVSPIHPVDTTERRSDRP